MPAGTEDAEIELCPAASSRLPIHVRPAYPAIGRVATSERDRWPGGAGTGHQRRGWITRDCAVWQARQLPHVTMASGVVAAPHSGHSTASRVRARASLI